MKRIPGFSGSLWLVGVVLFLSACGGSAAPAPSSSAASPAQVSLATASKPATSAAPSSASAKPAPSAAASAPASAKPAASGGASGAAAVALPKPEITSLKLGNAAHEADSFPPDYADSTGIYKKYGFQNVQSTYLDADAKTRQAVLGGQIDVAAGGAGSVISSLKTDIPLLSIGMYIQKPLDVLAVRSSIKNVQDLKGKKIAVSSLGGDSHASVLLSLKALGLKTSDVNIVIVGGEGQRIAALTAGSIDAAPVGQANEQKVKQLGMNILVRLPDTNLTLAREGIMVRRDWAHKNPNTVLNLLAAQLEALQLMYKDPTKATDAFVSWIGSNDKAARQDDVPIYLKVATRDFKSTLEGWQNLREVMVTADPGVKDVDLNTAFDNSYLDKLKTMGVFQQLGIPNS